MSEKILNALMQLFAIIAKVDGVTTDGRKVVQLFLKQQLNQDLVDKYLEQFDNFLADQPDRKRPDGAKKRTSVKDSVRVLLICTQINEELTQKQKIVVLIRLLEFITADKVPSEGELEFVNTVASTFNIEESEFGLIKGFVLEGEKFATDSPDILVIDNKPSAPAVHIKHILSENLDGQLRILRIQSVGIYIVTYLGNSELYLNGQGIRRHQVYFLINGSSIRSSKINPIYYSDIISCYMSDAVQSKIVFSIDGIEYKFKNGKQGLHRLNLSEESGRLIGIMGASGAGKSTLLNILNGIEKPTTGKVTVNGIDIHNESDKIEGVIGFVSQDDLLIEELTVFQNLFYNAKLCFGDFSDEKITEVVHKLLDDLGLFEIKHLKVGNPLNKKISGGQRKRLNIGLELIREPSVLFVDEPTSGLSSRDSENIMDLLKELSLKGKQVYVVIHQPSSDIFKMFDKLLIIDVGGYPVYYGNPVDAISYFKRIINHVNSDVSECSECGNVNPEQIFNILESKVLDEYGSLTRERKISPKQWNSYYAEILEQKITDNGSSLDAPKSSFNIPNKIKQFVVFVTRDLLSKLSNTQYMLINVLEAPVLAFILAYLVKYYDSESGEYIFRDNENLPAYLFMNVVVALFMGLTVSAEEIIRDRKIQKRESFLNLSRSSYLYSKVTILFLISALQSISFVLLGNWILEIKGMTLDYWLILFTTSCFANMLGLNISASFNSAVTIYILIPILLIPQLLLSGVIVKFDKLNPVMASSKYVPIAGEMMTSRWAFEALAVNQFRNNEFEKEFYKYDRMMSRADFKKNFWISSGIKSRLDYCMDNVEKPEDKEKYAATLDLIRNEIRKEMDYNPKIKLEVLDQVIAGKFNYDVGEKIKAYLDKLTKFYLRTYNKFNNSKDSLVSLKQATPEAKKAFLDKRNKYQNESLSDLVKNSKDLDRIIEKGGELIQKVDPVYMDPLFDGPLDFRAHFFAPRKQFMGRYYDTFWVNISVLWAMTVILYVTLYFELLKKLIDFGGNLPGLFTQKGGKG